MRYYLFFLTSAKNYIYVKFLNLNTFKIRTSGISGKFMNLNTFNIN